MTKFIALMRVPINPRGKGVNHKRVHISSIYIRYNASYKTDQFSYEFANNKPPCLYRDLF